MLTSSQGLQTSQCTALAFVAEFLASRVQVRVTEKDGESQRKREIFNLLAHSLEGCYSHSLAKPKPGAQTRRPSSAIFPGCQQGAELHVKQLGHELVPGLDSGVADISFTQYATILALTEIYFHTGACFFAALRVLSCRCYPVR